MKKIAIALAAVLLAGCDSGKPATPPGPAPVKTDPPKTDTPKTDTPAPKNDTGAAPDPDIAITGKVTFVGTAPKRGKVKVDADPMCVQQYGDNNPYLKDDLIVGADNGIKNVIVWVKGGLEGRTFDLKKSTVTLGQKGCRYEPHVIAITAGSDIKVVNDDNTLHNVHLLPEANALTPDNVGQKPGNENTWTVKTSEPPFKIKCDIHPWMGAWCLVSKHPYFMVTGEDGAYELKGLPPGEYVVEAWHEILGAQTKTVKVGAKEKKTQDFGLEKR
jgi:plastocyanin